MSFELKEYKTNTGEVLLYTGSIDLEKLELVSKGAGDIWHSSFEQGYKNAFPELVYQTATYFWYLNDFDGLDECVSWRINPTAFAVRKSVWELTNGFDTDYENDQMKALDFGFRSIRFLGGVPLYIKNLFSESQKQKVVISRRDRHLFFRKNFKTRHAVFMIYRLGLWNFSEWITLFKIKNNYTSRNHTTKITPRKLKEITGNPSVSYVIPTMLRQDFTLQLLDDLSLQIYKPSQVVVVDATPESQRNEALYNQKVYPFELKIIWQKSKGSCRARNEAIDLCTEDYIIFGDDDIRVPEDFIQNHIKFLQTNNASACNGIDITAENHNQDLNDLKIKLKKLNTTSTAGCALWFSNSNSCVKREYVNKLIGNDVNFDGGYGEDGDFGMSLSKIGVTVLANPFSIILHLKPPIGGYRFWGTQSKIIGKKRKSQPWELDIPVKWVRPVPSPTVMYGFLKHYSPQQVKEYKYKYFSYFLFNGRIFTVFYKLLKLPYKNLQYKKSVFYATNLLERGVRHK